jgi:hypothetical protein
LWITPQRDDAGSLPIIQKSYIGLQVLGYQFLWCRGLAFRRLLDLAIAEMSRSLEYGAIIDADDDNDGDLVDNPV